MKQKKKRKIDTNEPVDVLALIEILQYESAEMSRQLEAIEARLLRLEPDNSIDAAVEDVIVDDPDEAITPITPDEAIELNLYLGRIKTDVR